MSSHGKGLMFLLQRCVAVRQLTRTALVQTGHRALLGRCSFAQQRAWTSAARTVCLHRPYRLQSALTSSQCGFCTKAGEPRDDDEYPPLPTYESDSEPQRREVYIVQVKGLPWSCSAEDLLNFFSECRICDGVKGIHLILNGQGRPSGQAFIQMEHEEDIGKALEKHRQYLGPRYVEVFEVTNNDAEAILKKAAQTPANDGVVRLRGLPFTSHEDDIKQFFSGLEIVENGITIVTDYAGRNSGMAFVQFSSQEAADEALLRDRDVIGNRYIEVFRSRSDEIHSSKRKRDSAPPQTRAPSANRRIISQPNPQTGSPQNSGLPPHYIHMRGLPFNVSGEAIVRFFSPLVVSKIMMECGPDGRPSGEAGVCFSCHQDATAAMSRDREYIGGRYIELFLNSIPESERW